MIISWKRFINMFNFKNLEIEKLDVVGSICKINEMELSVNRFNLENWNNRN